MHDVAIANEKEAKNSHSAASKDQRERNSKFAYVHYQVAARVRQRPLGARGKFGPSSVLKTIKATLKRKITAQRGSCRNSSLGDQAESVSR